MSRTLEEETQLIKISEAWRRPGKGPHDDVEVRVGYALKHVPVLTQMMGGVRLRELRVTEVEEGWRVMFKGDRDGSPHVAYVFADSYSAAIVLALTSLDTGNCTWHRDHYPPQKASQTDVYPPILVI